MTFRQFMWYYNRKIFMKKLYEKCCLQTSSRSFLIFKERSIEICWFGQILMILLLFLFLFFFSICVFFHEHTGFTGQQGKEKVISLTPLYHFYPLHRHLDISWAIITGSSLLHIAGGQTRTKNLWFPRASR